MSRYFSLFFIRCIRLYVKHRPYRNPMCRFIPTCSDYAIQSLQKNNCFFALYCIVLRLLKCHPWSGYPPFSIDEPVYTKNQGEK